MGNADTCYNSTFPATCGCSGNAPSFEPCPEGTACLGESGCSCQDVSECQENADNCDTVSVPSSCKCGIELPCELEGSVCLTDFNTTGSYTPACSCDVESNNCPDSANECDPTTDPPSCKCNGREPCEPGTTCQEAEGQPECSCLTNSHCTGNTDGCDMTTCPSTCTCGGGPPCVDEPCIDGQCGVSSKICYICTSVSRLLQITKFMV